MQLYLDCDGVLADFEKTAVEIFGMQPAEFEDKYGANEFWSKIHGTDDFYYILDVLEDAHQLYDAVKHLNPIILTGVSGDHEVSKEQKVRWAAKQFGNEQKVICCLSKDKSNYCNSGDILVDDWTKYKHLWEAKGGVFVVHNSATESILKLKELNVI